MEYDGTYFCGWQRQISDESAIFPGSNRIASTQCCNDTTQYSGVPPALNSVSSVPSVQGTIEKALKKITSHRILVEGAGRTDAGVHATNQVAHFDLPSGIKPEKLQLGLNFYLQPFCAAIVKLEEVAPTFHARFSAKARQYEYHIVNRPAPLTIRKNRAWHVSVPLDISIMQKAAGAFVGCHNFNSFRAAECQSANPIKTIDSFEILLLDGEIIGKVQAKSFLHNQVRIMMGTLVLMGKRKISSEIIPELLKAEDRSAAGPTAPAYGLYLTGVLY